MGIVIENESVLAEISSHGAELCRLYDKLNGRELLWNADPAFWNRHAPILFPFVGKVNGGKYRYQGKAYSMGQHGFARDMEFELSGSSAQEVTFVLKDTPETLEKYPFRFELTVTHRLEGRTLQVLWQVKNPSETEPLYFSIGGHPAFLCPPPGLEGVKKENCQVRLCGFAGGKKQYVLIDPETEAVAADKPLELNERAEMIRQEKDNENAVLLKTEESLFTGDALIFDDGQIREASLCLPDGKPYITLSCPDFPSFGLWSKPNAGAPYICLEPWDGRCDNRGFTGELPEKYGELCLKPGSVYEKGYQIVVEGCAEQ